MVEDINNEIKLIQMELNMTKQQNKRLELTKKLSILNLKKEIEDIKKRIQQLSR